MDRMWRKLSLLWSGDLPNEAYIKYQFDNLRFVGIYPDFSKAPYWQRLGLYVIELFCLLQGLAMTWDLLESREDIERFGDGVCLLTSLILVMAKRCFCRCNIDDLLELVEEYCIGFELYRHREQQFVQQLHSYHRLESLIVNTSRILASVLCASLILYGLLTNGFILRAKYPFNTDTHIGYDLVFLIQALITAHALLTVLVLDLLCILVIGQLSLHFQLLSMEFATIGTELTVHEFLCRDEEVVARIKKHIIRHQYLLDLGNQVQKVLEPNIMGQFVASIILICMSAFGVLLAKRNVMLVLRFGAFVLCAFYQIFMWCFLGDLVAQKSFSICDAIANCNWIVLDSRLKKDLSFVMMRAQQPFIINVYRMFPLTFETFLAIVGRSYSAFTVLTEMI